MKKFMIMLLILCLVCPVFAEKLSKEERKECLINAGFQWVLGSWGLVSFAATGHGYCLVSGTILFLSALKNLDDVVDSDAIEEKK